MISREKARLRNLMKLAAKQVKEETKFDEEGNIIPKVELAAVEWQIQTMNQFETQQEEEDEIDDLLYEGKNDDEIAEIRRQT